MSRAPELRYMAGACMIGDLFISCFGGYKAKGMKNARAFVNMLASVHDNVTGYSDMVTMDILGKNAWVKSSVAYNSASQNN